MASAARTLTVAQDGSTGCTRIQAALDAAQPGDTVLVRAGRYVEDVHLRQGVTLRGEGPETTHLVAATGSAIRAESVADVTVADLDIDGDHKEGLPAVWLTVSRVTLTGCVVSGAALNGVEADRGSYLTLRASAIRGNEQAGVLVFQDSQGDLAENTVVENRGHGIAVQKQSRLTARANNIRGNGQAGVLVLEDSQGDFAENIIVENHGVGIAVQERGRLAARANTIRGNHADGVLIHGEGIGELVENTVVENTGCGVVVNERGRLTALANTIRGNQGAGVFILGDGEGDLTQNLIAENTLHGFEVRERGRVKLTSNSVVRNTPSGVWVYKEGRAELRQNIVACNGKWGLSSEGNPGDPLAAEVSLNRNCLWDNHPDYRGQLDTATDLRADPCFVDMAGGDYHLKEDSPCIGAGLNGEDLGALPFARPKPPAPPPPEGWSTPLRTHLRTLALCHVEAPGFPPARGAAWLRGAAAAGWPLPLGLARDLGLLLSQPAERVTIAEPAHLPFDEDTSAYQAFLTQFAAQPLVRDLPQWKPPISDSVLGVILARLVEGVGLPDAYRVPTGPDGVLFGRVLGDQLAGRAAPRMAPQPRPSRPLVRLDALREGEGAAFGDWTVWRVNAYASVLYVALVYREGPIAVESPESGEIANGWIRYQDENREGFVLYPADSPPSPTKLCCLPKLAVGKIVGELAREPVKVGRWAFDFEPERLMMTNDAYDHKVTVEAHHPEFTCSSPTCERRTFSFPEPGPKESAPEPTGTVSREGVVPGGGAGMRGALAGMGGDPAQIWRDTPEEERPTWRVLLPAAARARIERNLLGLKREDLRFLASYGAPLAGAPDPRDLLDLLTLTNLPAAAGLALSQTLKLMPRVCDARGVGGVQTYPEGGYEGLALRGSLDSLLPTELAYPDEVFLHRVLNHEALYYGRERPRERRRELAYVVMQVGYGLGGDGQVLARALALALSDVMRRRGYEVLYSVAGAELSEPRALDKPGEVARVLYQYEPVLVDGGRTVRAVVERLRSWREAYRSREVLWVVSEHFDADEAEEHAGLYELLRGEGGQQAWYIRVCGDGGDAARGVDPPPTARHFARWQLLPTARMWERA